MSSNSSRTLLLLLPFLFSTVLCASLPSSTAARTLLGEASTEFIDEVCRGVPTPDYGWCVYKLESDRRAAGANLTGLAHIAIESTSEAVGKALVDMQKLEGKAEEGSDLKFALEDCVDLYDTCFFWAAEANNFLTFEKDYEMVSDRAAKIHAYVVRCEDGLKEVPPGPSPAALTYQNHNVQVLAETIGSAADLILGRSGGSHGV